MSMPNYDWLRLARTADAKALSIIAIAFAVTITVLAAYLYAVRFGQ